MNNKKNIPLFMKRDILLITTLVLIAAAVFFLSNAKSGKTAVITNDGTIVKTINLETETNGEFYIGTALIEIKDGEIRFKDNNCKDKVCVKSGFIKNSGQTAACVPEKIAIEIGGSDKEADIIAY